jgi:hypothetical protein
MSADTANTILAIIGIISLVGSFIGFWWARLDTKSLAQLTAKLEYRIQSLVTQLDQSIKRLERCRELTALIHEASLWLIFESRKSSGSDVSSKVTAYMAELRALAVIIGDEQLTNLIEEMPATFALKKNLDAPWTLKEPIEKMNNLIQKIHTRIYEILDKIVRVKT